MNGGWIKLHRDLLYNPLGKRPTWAWLWCVLLLKANHKPQKWMYDGGIIIVKEGQLITSRDKLADASGLPPSTVERVLKYLENEHQIEQLANTKFRLITIVNWKSYQNTRTGRRTTDEQQMNTNKNVKNDKNVKNKTTEHSSGDEVSLLIDLFKDINPSYRQLFARPPQRSAAERLLKLHAFEWWQRFLEAYATKLADRYCPKATTPIQLEEKLGQITAYAARLKAPSVKII